MSSLNELDVGIIGEHLVCVDLLLQGYRAFMTQQNCPYDVAVDVEGKLIRIQVKTTRKMRIVPQRVNEFQAYMWNVKRKGKNGSKTYGDNDFDVLALVALDIRRIAYVTPTTIKYRTVHITEEEGRKHGKTFNKFPFSLALEYLSKA